MVNPFVVQPITPTQFLSQSAVSFSTRSALEFMGYSITYTTLADLVNRLAQALTDLGIRPGDRVAIMVPNLPQFVVANYAVLKLGAVVTPVNTLYTAPELAYQLNNSGAETLVVLDILAAKAEAVWAQTQLKRLIICHLNDLIPVPSDELPTGSYTPIEPGEGVWSYQELQNKYPIGHTFPDQSHGHQLAALLYTGGTTGQSKGVMLTHTNLSASIQQLKAHFGGLLRAGQERQLALSPFFLAASYTAVQLAFLSYGGTLALSASMEPDTLVTLLDTFAPTFVSAPPALYIGLLNHPYWPTLDLSAIHVLCSGTTPLPLTAQELLKARCPQVLVTDAWGMGELSAFGTMIPVTNTKTTKVESVGIPLPGTTITIMDVDTGCQLLPIGQEGEICVQGPQVMRGYWQQPDATASVLDKGWLHTGDIGYLDKEGWLYIVEHKKDVILTNGYPVYPRELDEVLFTHPAILEACCIGIPDRNRGETVKAFIIPRTDRATSTPPLTTDEITAFCRERLAPYKIPRQIEFVTDLPRSAVGKILRWELQRMERLRHA